MKGMKLYHDFYVCEHQQKNKKEWIQKLQSCSLFPNVYLITLAGGKQNQLEFFSSILLQQQIIRESDLFVVGLADGYEEALELTEMITQEIYRETGTLEIRQTIEKRQREYDRMRQEKGCYM